MENIGRTPGEYLENRLEKRLKSLHGEDIIEIPRRMRYNCNDERRCKNEQSERD